jgi:alkyl sulfatase BDS1-like metallo-beta-lactamase superfamily hydrolase
MVVNWTFPDTKETATLVLSNSALSHTLGRHADKPDAHIHIDRSTLDQINLQQRSFGDAVRAGNVRIVGNPQLLLGLLSMLDSFKPSFEIVVPLGMDSGGPAAGVR